MDGDNTDNDTTLLFDLRQRRAKVIGDCIDDVIEACKNERYYQWLKNIDDLYSISRHTFKDKKKDVEEKYNTKRKEVINLANTYQQDWLNKTSNPLACSLIDAKLRELFELIMDALEEANIFGTKYEDEDSL
jgi:glutamyl-tRNA reductase